jgi:hypothetical protein
MRHPKNELDISKTHFQTTRKCKRHLETLRHLVIFFLAIFFGLSWVCVLQTGFYRPKKHFTVAKNFSQKLRHLESIHHFNFPKKSNAEKDFEIGLKLCLWEQKYENIGFRRHFGFCGHFFHKI